MSDASRLLNSLGNGDPRAAAELLPLVYEELRSLARAQMGHERGDHTLQATALVHEAYLRLVGQEPIGWDGRRHFFAAAAESMRRILVEHARSRNALKHGGRRGRVELADELPVLGSPHDSVDDVLALNDALDRLSGVDPSLADLVKLSFFAGLSLEEAAVMLGISRATAYRRWTFARAWLRDAMSAGPTSGASEQEP